MKNAFFNRIKIIFLSLMCVFCSIFFFACSNLFSPENSLSDGEKNSEKFYEINGNLFVDGSYSKIFENTNQARSVSAKVPGAIFYAVIAKNAENSEKSYTAEVSGSAFSIKLSKGTWNITAEGFSDSEKTVSVLKGSASVSVEDENSVKSGISIKMLPQTDGKGNISLSIEAENGSGIKSVSAELTKNGEGSSVYSERLNFSGNAAKFEKSEISSGVYLLSLKFYSGNDGYGELLYTAQEIVNVFNNLTTDTWQGNSVYFNGGKFEVSKSAVESFKMNTFFVQGESEATYSPVTSADDGNAGTYFAPFATVQAAVDKINAINDGTTEYTIFVDGTVTAYSSGDYSANNSSFVNISPASTLSLAIKSLSSEKAVIDAGRNGQNADTTGWRVFYIGSKANVVFENITVTGGSLDETGGGIYAKGSLTLKNCTVTKNKSNNAGGGISFSGKELVLENTSVTYNKSSGNGGGINADGKVTISGSEILNNSATDNGGGIYFGDGEKIISDTKINKNFAKYGGGIFMQNGTLNLKSGAIIGEKLDPDNEANNISKVAKEDACGNWSTKQLDSSGNYAEGAGIHVAAGTVNMKDGAYICRNYTECTGGGIVIKSGGTFNMTGGIVGWNYSNYGGGIRCDGKLNISGNSIICYNKVSTQYVQGFCGRGAGILVNGDEGGNAKISGNTKIFGNQTVRGDSTNIDALGAGIYCSGTLTVEGGKIHDNFTESDGAAIGIESGVVTLSDCKIESNGAGRNGGAIFISTVNKTTDAKLTIKENVSIDSNRTDGNGGAIYATTNQHEDYAQGKNSYVYIGEDENTGGIVITGNNAAERGGAFYGADNARFVMNAGEVSENYSTGSDSGHGGGAMFIWGSQSNYSTFTMNGGVISGNRAKFGGAGGAVHIDHGSGGKAAFIMTGGLLESNYACNAYNDPTGSNLGGAIYVKNGGQIKLSGSAVIAVSEESDNCNDIYLGINETTSVQQKITIIGKLAPGNNAATGNQKYTARITPEKYTVGNIIIQGEPELDSSSCSKFLVTPNSTDELKYKIKYDSSSKTGQLATTENIVINGRVYEKTALEDVIVGTATTITGSGSDGVFIDGRTVTLSPYSIGKYEVTQELFEAVMGENPSITNTTDNLAAGETQELRPVETIMWYHAVVFCNKLSALVGLEKCYTITLGGTAVDIDSLDLSGIEAAYKSWTVSCDLTKNGYRLPTAAEWEFAARGGNQNADDWNYTYAGSDSIDDVAWYKDNSDGISHEVGMKNPNSLGLYDMSGNCWEFCWDITYNRPSKETVTDPMGESGYSYRSRPSGSYSDEANYAKVIQRNSDTGTITYTNNGFRLARSGFPRAN